MTEQKKGLLTKEMRFHALERAREILENEEDLAGLIMFHYVTFNSDDDSVSVNGYSGSAGLDISQVLMAFGLYAKRLVDETHENAVGEIRKKIIWDHLLKALINISKAGDSLEELSELASLRSEQ